MIPALPGEPFDLVLDVGGNIGEWAEQAQQRWPGARVVSFEPVPELAAQNRARSAGRWDVHELAISDRPGWLPLLVCVNQHPASTMMEPGGARRREFGITDNYLPISVETGPLDEFLSLVNRCVRCGRPPTEHTAESGGCPPDCETDWQRPCTLVKVDVEGHERQVLAGGGLLLARATTVIVECQQDPDIYLEAPSPGEVDGLLRSHGLAFQGVAGVLCAPAGRVLQFDGVWSRPPPLS